MTSDDSVPPDGDSTEASKRWSTDAAGHRVYYPRGRSLSGYLVSDPAREGAIREADRRFFKISNQVAPFLPLLLLPVFEVYYHFSSSHPVLACAVFPSAIVLLGFFIWLVRRPTMAPLLAGLTRVPPDNLAGRTLLYRAGYVLLGSIGVVALVLYAYDQRVTAASVGSKTVDFYPDISQHLLGAFVAGLMMLCIIAGRNRLSAKFGRLRRLLAVSIFAVLAMIPAAIAILNFSNPRPEIKLSDLALSCGNWGMGWFQITNLTLRAGSRGRQYAEIEYDDGVPHLYRLPSESCEIDGLNADYADVYDAIHQGWQAGKTTWAKLAKPSSIRPQAQAPAGSVDMNDQTVRQ